MVTGVECAGIVLAVLPIFVQVAKGYSDGTESILNVAIKNRLNRPLRTFYLELCIQLVYLDDTMRSIWAELRRACSNPTDLPPHTKLLADESWNPDLERQLRQYFPSENHFDAFTGICKSIVILLHELIKDKSSGIFFRDQNIEVMMKELRPLARTTDSDTAESTLEKRFRFFKHEKKRAQCLDKLRKYVKDLERLRDQAECQRADANFANPLRQMQFSRTGKAPPSLIMRNLLADLYPAFQKYYQCPCTGEHDIKICLQKESYQSLDLRQTLGVDFLLSLDLGGCAVQDKKWHEGNIMFVSECLQSTNGHVALEKLCQAFPSDMQDLSVALILQNSQGHQLMKRQAGKPRRLRFSNPNDPISLDELFKGSKKLNAREKRELGIIFAESLLLYHDSDWLHDGWKKEDICFFFKEEEEPDTGRPFFSARSARDRADSGAGNMTVYHPNLSILTLGVLLIELFTEIPIERWKKRTDLANPSPTAVQLVAERVAKGIDPVPFREAIEACLNLNWIPTGHSPGLEDPATREGLIREVIGPLRKEADWLH